MVDLRNEIKFSFLFVIVIIILGLGLFLNNIYTVNTGEVAIISTFGKVSKIEGEGLHFKVPFMQSKFFMETREKIFPFTKAENSSQIDSQRDREDNSLTASTKDMQSVNIELTVQASIIDPEKLYRSFKGHHENRFIRPRVREIVQATIAKYTIEEFVSKRAEISNIIFKSLEIDFEKYGLNTSNISIVNHDFSDEYEKAIEMKKVAEQSVERARAEQQKLAVEGENKVKLAEYKLKEKELQAKANIIESNSLTPKLLEKMAIEKWDGALPKVQTSGQGSFILPDISGNK